MKKLLVINNGYIDTKTLIERVADEEEMELYYECEEV